MNQHASQLAQKLRGMLPQGIPVAIIGSTSFWHADSQQTCQLLGQALAAQPEIVLLTGGVTGIGEACGRSFYQARLDLRLPPQVVHVMPEGMAAWDYGLSLYAGQDMQERRAVLARMAPVYIVIEGGPATADEVRIALENGATLIPFARSGACAHDAYAQICNPQGLSDALWAVLGSDTASIQQSVAATMDILAGLRTAWIRMIV